MDDCIYCDKDGFCILHSGSWGREYCLLGPCKDYVCSFANAQQNRRRDEIDHLESIILLTKSRVFDEIYADVNRILLFSVQK